MLERDLGDHGSALRDALGGDAAAWAALFGHLAGEWERLLPGLLRPVLRPPRHPILMARFGLPALLPATTLARLRFREPAARALFAGMSAHSMLRLGQPLSSSFGLVLGMLAHGVGWPMARGGSGRIAAALEAEARSLGVRDRDGPVGGLARRAAGGARRPVRPDAAPGAGGRGRPLVTRLPAPARGLPLRPRRAQGRLGARRPDPVARRAHAACRDGAPRRDDARGRGLGGRGPARPASRIARSSCSSSRPSPTRRAPRRQARRVGVLPRAQRLDGRRDRGHRGAGRAVRARVPGPRLGRSRSDAAAMEAYDANYVGGDINGGVQDVRQLLFRPVVRWNPYTTSIRACSGLVVHAAWGRRPWHERRARRARTAERWLARR